MPIKKINACDEEAMKVKVKDGRVIETNKTMEYEASEGEIIGIAKINKNVIRELDKAVVELMKEKAFMSYFEGAVQKVIDEQRFRVKLIPTQELLWSEVDCIQDYQRASAGIPDSLIHMAKEEF